MVFRNYLEVNLMRPARKSRGSLQHILVITLLACPALAKDRKTPPPPPNEFVVGQRTFIDIGPPFTFYDIFIIRGEGNKTYVKKLAVTPPGSSCVQPAKVELAAGEIASPVSALWLGKNPCAISEKDVRKEAKRRKKGLVFSGADVFLQLQCGSTRRVIKINVLDRDMFDPRANTPEHTSWTMQLMSQLQSVTGPGALDKPIFGQLEAPANGIDLNDAAVRELKQGTFDGLFGDSGNLVSALFESSQAPLPQPQVNLTSSVPFMPATFAMPIYPPISRLAGVEGTVAASVSIADDGTVASVEIVKGHKMLEGAAINAIKLWRFPADASGKQTTVTIQFVKNCPSNQQ